MLDTHWAPTEKRIARRVYDAALARELAEVLAEFKQRAAAAKEPGDIWDTGEYLARTRKELDGKYDYRYSRWKGCLAGCCAKGALPRMN